MAKLIRKLRKISVGPRIERTLGSNLRNGYELLKGDWRTRLIRDSQDGRPDLRNADFRECSLEGLDLSTCRLERCVFDGASLDGARLDCSDLTGTSFVACSMRDARLDAVRGLDTRFDRADLRGSTFVAANLAHSSFRQSLLQRANLNAATFFSADLRNASFQETTRAMTDFEEADTTCIAAGVELATSSTAIARDTRAPSFAGAIHHYLAFLNLNGAAAERALRAAEAAVEHSENLQVEIRGLIQSLPGLGWRAHLIAAVAAMLGGADDETVSALWKTIERDAWSSPQLLVAISKLDPKFREHVTQLLQRPKLALKTRGAIAACTGQPMRSDELSGFELASKWAARFEALTEPVSF